MRGLSAAAMMALGRTMGRRRGGWRRLAFLGAAALAARYLGQRGGLQGIFGQSPRQYGQRQQGQWQQQGRSRFGTQEREMGDADSIAQSSPYGSGVERGGEQVRR